MMSALAPLLVLAQVGPAPGAIPLEPLPIPRPRQTEAESVDPLVEQAKLVAQLTVDGNRAIVAGNPAEALALFDRASIAAVAAGQPMAAGEIDIDRARAMMLLERYEEAAGLLASLRSRFPGNADIWVHSAIAARRMENLAEAQRLIEEAGTFAPANPGVGLEAGTIAWVAGRDEAALKSWNSVVEVSPDSDEAEVARQYIESARIELSHGEEPARR